MKKRFLIALAATAAALASGCSTTPVYPYYTEPAEGKTALLRVGGEGLISVRTVEEGDRESCFLWHTDRDFVLSYLEGVPVTKPLPYQGRSLGIPESTATKRFRDRNRWAEIRVPAGKEIEIMYSLPYERIPGTAPKIKLREGDEMPEDLGAICRTGFRMTPEAGKAYQASFIWGGHQGDYTCSAVFTSLPGEQIVRVKQLDPCHTVDLQGLTSVDGLLNNNRN